MKLEKSSLHFWTFFMLRQQQTSSCRPVHVQTDMSTTDELTTVFQCKSNVAVSFRGGPAPVTCDTGRRGQRSGVEVIR